MSATVWLGLGVSLVIILGFSLVEPFGISLGQKSFAQGLGLLVFTGALYEPLRAMLQGLPVSRLTRHQFEGAIVRFLMGFGYVFFTAIVIVPFYVMVMTSIKGQQSLLLNPLDFSIDWSKGWELLRSYDELFTQFNFGSYLLTSAAGLCHDRAGDIAVQRAGGPMRWRGCASPDRPSCPARSCSSIWCQ